MFRRRQRVESSTHPRAHDTPADVMPVPQMTEEEALDQFRAKNSRYGHLLISANPSPIVLEYARADADMAGAQLQAVRKAAK